MLTLRKDDIKKLLVLGNSLTVHGPSTDELGWNGCWGMAATALDNDYVHRLYSMLCEYISAAPQLVVDSFLAVDFPGYKAFTAKNKLLQSADIVVIQCGDNMKDSEATKENFEDLYCGVVEGLRRDGCSLVLCVGCWGQSQRINEMIKSVCAKTGSSFVDIAEIGAIPENCAKFEGIFSHPGVAWHPGDMGMNRIAVRIFDEIKKHVVV